MIKEKDLKNDQNRKLKTNRDAPIFSSDPAFYLTTINNCQSQLQNTAFKYPSNLTSNYDVL